MTSPMPLLLLQGDAIENDNFAKQLLTFGIC